MQKMFYLMDMDGYKLGSCISIDEIEKTFWRESKEPVICLTGQHPMEQAISGRSKIRNVCIAEVFSRMGIIEQWGTGIQRMIQGCKEYGVQEPEFIDMGDAFRVNFYRLATESGIETSIKKDQTGTEIVVKPNNTGTESMVTGIQNVANVQQNNKMKEIAVLSATERKVIGLILENPGITQERMAENIGMSQNGIRYVMGKLKDRGILAGRDLLKRESGLLLYE